MLDIVHKSWFMFFRRLYLSYNVALAALLIAMQGLSFGIQLFYKFRLVELDDQFNRFSTMMSQISIVAKIIVMSILCSMVLAKCVALGRMVWRAGQFQILGSKAARFFMMRHETHPYLYRFVNIVMQLVLLVFLELIPFVCGLAVAIMARDIKLGLQVWLSAGVLIMILMVFGWWLGSIIESYKRLIMFCMQRNRFFIKFERLARERAKRRKRNRNATLIEAVAAMEHMRAQQQLLRHSETEESGSASPSMTADNAEDTDTDMHMHMRIRALSTASILSTSRARSLSALSTYSTYTDVGSVFNTATADDNFSILDDPLFPGNGDKRNDQEEDLDDPQEYANNLWVVLYYFCCLAEIFKHMANFAKSRLKRRNMDDDISYAAGSQQGERPPSLSALLFRQILSIKMRNIWIGFGIVLLFFIAFSISLFQIWKLFIVTAVIAVGALASLLLNKISFIPHHNPNKKRLKYIWIHGNILDKYVGLVEEIFYHSPKVVFRACKFIFFLLSFLISVCLIFEFSETATIFLVPASLTALIMLFYILRFNALPIYENVYSLYSGKRFTSTEKNEDLVESLMAAEVIDAEAGHLPQNEITADMSNETAQEQDDATPNHLPNRNTFYGSTDARDNLIGSTQMTVNNENDNCSKEQALTTSQARRKRAIPKVPNHRELYHISRTESRVLRLWSVLFLSLVLSVGVSLVLVITIIFQGLLSFLVFFTMLAMMCFIMFMRYDDEIAGSMLGFFILFATLLGGIFLIGSIQMSGVDYTTSSVVGHYVNKTDHTYPICQEQWHGFGIVDYAFFSRLAYLPEPHFTQDFNTWFPELVEEGARLEYRENRTVSFYDVYIPSRNISIIGVRGTHSLMDVIQDVDLWKEAALLQAASLVGPFVSTWPETMTQWIIWAVASLERLTANNDYWDDDQRYYYDVLDNYIDKIKGTRNIVLTGHSLGGGLCKITGAKHKLKAVTFSGPGVTLSSMKLGLNTTDINRHVVSVKPMSDLVAKIDIDAGLTQIIDCHGNFLGCHLLSHTTQELIRSCGSDERGRWIKSV